MEGKILFAVHHLHTDVEVSFRVCLPPVGGAFHGVGVILLSVHNFEGSNFY